MNIVKLTKENFADHILNLRQKQNNLDIESQRIQRELDAYELKQFKAATKDFVGKCFRKKLLYSKRYSYYFIEKINERCLIVTSIRHLTSDRFEIQIRIPYNWKAFKLLHIYTAHKISKKLFDKVIYRTLENLTTKKSTTK
jgi:hypothetical protein